jgi:hypothetical protein
MIKMTQTNSIAISALKKMLACCQSIQVLLKQDQDYLRQNALLELEASNLKKANLLIELESASVPLKTVDMDNYSDAEKLMIDLLHTEIASCYQDVATNGQVITENLNQIKMMHDYLHKQFSQDQSVYDGTATLK